MAGEDLVSLLYGELPADEAERTGARVAADPTLSARLGEMRRVRDLFGSLEDEEPPARLSAQLMSEAARAAPQPRRAAAPEAGLWARFVSWLQPLVQRPALAAAASLVLVAGVAGVLYMKKGDELTSTAPPVAETERTLEGTATGATADPAATASPATAVPEAPDDTTGTAGDGDRGDDQAAPAAEPADTESAGNEKQPARRRKSASTGKSAETDKKVYSKAPAKPAVKSGTVYGLSEQEMVPRDQAKGESGEGGGGVVGGAADDSSNKADVPAAPPPPVSAPAPAPAESPKSVARPSVRELHNRAIDAALDNRCSEVRALAGQVKSADSAYYAKNVAGDGRLKTCLSQKPAKKK